MSSKQDVNTAFIVTTGLIGIALLLVIILGVQAWFYSQEQGELTAKSANAAYLPLADLRADQLTRIREYRWVDVRKQTVAIPIDQAMKLLLQYKGRVPATQPQNAQTMR